MIYGDFEWDDKKAQQNLAAHGVTFEDATAVFDDPFYIIYADPDHSMEEERFIVIGESESHRYLFVSYTERGERTRIISARELTAKERKSYEGKKERF